MIPRRRTIRQETHVNDSSRPDKERDPSIPDEVRQLVLRNTSNPVMTTKHGIVAEANSTLLELLGLERDQFVGRSILDVLTADSGAMALRRSDQRRAGERVDSSFPYHFIGGAGREVMVRMTGLVWPADDSIVLGLGLDISEFESGVEALGESEAHHRTMAEALKTSEETVRTLLTNVPGAVYRRVFEPTRPAEFFGDGIADILGYTAAELVSEGGPSYFDLIHPDDKRVIVGESDRAIAEHRPFVTEYRIRHADGAYRWVQERGQGVYADDGTPAYCFGLVLDITERKMAEHAIAEEEARLGALIQNVPGAIFRCSHRSRRGCDIKFFGSAIESISGYPASQFGKQGTRSYCSLIHPDDRVRITDQSVRLRETREYQVLEYRILHADGDYRWVQERASWVHSPFDKTVWLDGVIIDITEGRLAEDALRKSEARYRAIVEDQFEMVSRWSPDGVYTFANDAFCRFFGLTSEEVIGHMPDIPFPPGEREALEEKLFRLDPQNPAAVLEHRIIGADGETRWLRVSYRLILDDNGFAVEFQSVARDITERLRVDQALRESEANLRSLVASIPGAVYRNLSDREWTAVFLSEAILDIAGYPASDFIGNRIRTFSSIAPADFQEQLRPRVIAAIEAREAYEVEYPIMHADGDLRWVLDRGRGVFDDSGELIYVDGILFDITPRKLAEQALRETEERFRLLAENASDIIWTADMDGRFTYVSQAVRHLGYEPHEWIGKTVFDFIASDEREFFTRMFAANRGREGTRAYEVPAAASDGRSVWMDVTVDIVLEDGVAVRMQGISRDVTDRRLAEEALRESEAKYKNLVETTDTGYLILDADERVVDANAEYIRLTGRRSLQDIVGRSVLEWTADYDLERNAQEVRKCAEQGFARELRIDYVTPEGVVVPVDINANVIETRDGPRILALCRDVTTRRQAEEALRAAEERYRLLAENASDIIWQMDYNRVFQYVSQSVRTMGYEPDDVVGHNIEEFLPSEYHELVRWNLEENKNSLHPRRYELPLRRKDGEIAWLEASVTTTVTEGGPIGVQAIARDVTGRRLAEEALRESEQKFHSIFDNANALILAHDSQWRVVSMNPYACQLLGYEPGEMIGKDIRVMIETAEFDKAEWVRQSVTVDPELNVEGFEQYYLKKGGGRVLINWNVSALRGRDGSAIGIQGVGQDITERRAAEQALRESEEKYRSIVENTEDLIMLTEPEGVISYLSPACSELLGYEPDELIGMLPTHLIHPDDREDSLRLLQATLGGSGGSGAEYRLIAKSGEVKWISHVWNPVLDEDGKLHLIVSVVRDITQRRLVEDTLRAANADLEKAYKLQQEFLNNVTHEVRTPLTAVQGYARMLLEGIAGPLNDEQASLLHRVVNSTNSLIDVVTSILEIARVRSGAVALRPRACKPSHIVYNAVSSITPQARQKGVALSTTVTGEDVMGMYDEEKVIIILTNLLSNAAKFTDEGSIEVMVACESRGIEVIVVDTGVGMSQAGLEGIFDEFTQLDYPGKHKPTGFGLGLAIVGSMVDAIGATLTVSSKRGVGTAFTLYAPVMEG